ncbi:hypothetical protein RKD18_008024 [Streptomyces phaeoluteigriseus]
MPFEQHINWTVLPAGLTDDGTQVRVSVFIAPRLTTTDQPQVAAADQPVLSTLGNFPDFVTWPERVKAATFEFATGEDMAASSTSFTGRLEPQGPPPEANLWKKLFTEDTPLELFVFKCTDVKDCHTYSANEVSRLTRHTYAEAAKMSPEREPAARDVMPSLSTPPPGVEGLAAGQDAMPDALAALTAFHTITRPPTIAREDDSPMPPTKLSQPDFHQMLTSLGDHPKLLRRLGLVLDFLLPADRLPVSSGERFLTVTPHWTEPHADSHDVSPHTFYVFLPDRHVLVPGAKSRTTADPLASPSRGVLALPEEDFSLEQADIDGAALKIAAHIRMASSSDARGVVPGADPWNFAGQGQAPRETQGGVGSGGRPRPGLHPGAHEHDSRGARPSDPRYRTTAPARPQAGRRGPGPWPPDGHLGRGTSALVLAARARRGVPAAEWWTAPSHGIRRGLLPGQPDITAARNGRRQALRTRAVGHLGRMVTVRAPPGPGTGHR